MIGKLAGMLKNRDGEWVISFSTPEDFREEYDALDGKEIRVEIKRYSRKRSLDANAYCWVLIDQIAQATGVKKSEVYRNAIKEIGGVSTTVCVLDKAVERLKQSWSAHGLGWQTEVMDSKLDGCKNVTLYYGSSVYDVAQMSQLINSLVQDAEQLGIHTITPDEEKRMMRQWGKRTEGNHGDGNGSGDDHSTESGRISQEKHG